jgi:predicted RNA-binding Zn ribbon-like protein
VIPTALVTLANLGRPRRPSRAPARSTEPVLPDAVTASGQLEGVIALPVREVDLPGLRALQRFAVRAAEALLDGDVPEPGLLNDLAGDSSARVRLTAHRGFLHTELTWRDVSVVGQLARRLIEELASLDPTRLRRCAREQCGLLFYDGTRSRTQRWHAEDPCGWRERQHTRRARV